MAGRGPAPRAQHQRERDTRRRQAGTVALTPDGLTRGPELPADRGWHARTVSWWDVWRRSAQAQLFEETDWLDLLNAATLIDYVHAHPEKPSAAALSEIRLITSNLGGNYVDRQRARITITRPGDDETEHGGPGTVTALPTGDERRRALEARLRGGNA